MRAPIATLVCVATFAFTLPARAEPDEAHVPRAIEEAGPPPAGDFPEPPPSGEPRTLNGALSLGPGWLALRDDLGRDGQRATSVSGRLGLVVMPQLNLFVAFDRAATDRGGATFAQTAALLGAQYFFFDRVYVGGAVGLGWVAETGVPNGLSDGPTPAFSAHAGVEVWRTRHAALTAEAGITFATYERESWEMGGLRLGLVVF